MKSMTNRARRGWLAVLTAAAVAVSGMVAGIASPAAADENSKIVLTDAKFTHVTDRSAPVTGRNEVWVQDYLEFSVNYDATAADPKPGDSFYVALPSQLTLRDTAALKDLKTEDGTVAGQCKLVNATTAGSPNVLTCTFNDAIKDKIDVKGSIKANLYVKDVTTANTVDVDLNGKSSPVILPYDKPIAPRPVKDWAPRTKPAKYSSGVGSQSKGINWHIAASGQWINANHPDGKVVIQDNLTPGVLLPHSDKSRYTVSELCQDPNKTSSYTTVVKADANGKSIDGFTLTLTVANTQDLTLEASGPWKANCEYVFSVPTVFASGLTIDKNYDYTNSAKFTLTTADPVTASRTYAETFQGTIQYRDGFGGFKLTKLVQGDDAAAYANHEYTFAYTCSDKQSGEVKVSQAGGVVVVDKQFPNGTTCTITETNYARAGYEWAGTETQQVTIKAGETAQLNFVNTYTKQPTVVKLVDPSIVEGTCPVGATEPTKPTVTTPTVEGLTYGEPVITTEGSKITVTVTVTVADGYTVAEVPAGWTKNSNGTFTYTKELTAPSCPTASASPTVNPAPTVSVSPVPTVTPSPTKAPAPSKAPTAKPTPVKTKPAPPKTGS